MPRVILDRSALADLDDIWDSIAQDNPSAADRLLDALSDKFIALAEHPGLGRARPELAPRLRSPPAGNYIIFYRPADDGIEVARVLHAARDVDALFEM